MKIDKLVTYNLPGTLIESWKKHQGNQLLPLQAEAVTRFGLLQGRSLLVSSPTSSGKTFCGELAAASHLTRGHKVLYLVPLKAVAEEKYQDFQRVIANEVPAIFLYNPTYFYGAKATVSGINISKIVRMSDRFNGVIEWYVEKKSVLKIPEIKLY